MQGLTALVVRRPLLVLVFCLFVALCGTVGLGTLVREQYPNVDIPTVAVSLAYPGASTAVMRDAVVRPLEDQFAGAPGLDHQQSTVQNGQASIAVAFALGTDLTRDLEEVQRRITQAQAQLPADLPAPVVQTTDPSATTVVSLVASTHTLDIAQLSGLVRNAIVPALSQVTGISAVQVSGDVQPAVRVDADPMALDAQGVTLTDVIGAIQNNNARLPGGYAGRGATETGVEVRGDVTGADSVAATLLGLPVTGISPAVNPWSTSPKLLRLGDLAHVVDAAEPPQTVADVRGVPALTLDLKKATGASEVDASNAVLAALPAIQRAHPEVALDVLAAPSRFSQQQLVAATKALAQAIVLTAIVMLVFLRSWRNAIVVCVAIPTSLGATFAVMSLAHYTLDTVSLAAMTLVIGILVDDSTVVLENIERHHVDLGEPPRIAAVRGRGEIALAAVTLTLVDVAVFLPIAFLPGLIGRFLAEFGMVIVVATLTSLLVSFTVTPALAGRWSLESTWRTPRFIDALNRWFEAARDAYAGRLLPAALRHGAVIALACALAVVASIALVPAGAVGLEFLPPDDRGELFLQATLPSDASLAAAETAATRLERYVVTLADVRSEATLAGGYQSAFGGVIAQRNTLQVHLFLKDQRSHTTDWWMRELQRRAVDLVPGASAVAIPATGINGGPQQPIDDAVSVPGDGDPLPAARLVTEALRRTPGATMITTSAVAPARQLTVQFDRERLRALDVDIANASSVARAAFGGVRASQYETATGMRYVLVILPAEARTGGAALARLSVRARNGAIVRLGDLARFVETPVAPLITRINRHTVIHVGGNVAPGFALSAVQNHLTRQLARLHLPPGTAVGPAPSGSQQNLSDLVRGIGIALVLSFAIVYLLMVALYDALRTPLIVMVSVPVATIGALGALALFDQTLNLFSMIGLVMLVGLVTKNAILLVDFADLHRAAGDDVRTAVLTSARLRFRPIVMTTVSMVAGMLPIALALDPGSETRRALGVVVIGGLLSSLVLTLVLIPIAYLRFAPPLPSPDETHDVTGRQAPPTPA